MVVYPVNFLEVASQGLKLHSKTQVTANRHALLAGHGHNGRPIVLKNLQGIAIRIYVPVRRNQAKLDDIQCIKMLANCLIKPVELLTDMIEAPKIS